jgi:hypothetical protein
MPIDQAAIAQYLRDNLKIEISGQQEYASMGDGKWYTVEVKLWLGSSEISSSSTTIDIVE